MKKSIFAALLLLFFVSALLAEGPTYQIYSEGKGFLGMGGKKTIMLDKETGASWMYQDGKWVAIPRVEDELTAKARELEEQAKQEDEISKLKAKQEEELNQLKAKQEAEINAILAKQGTESKTQVKSETSAVPNANWRKAYKPRTVAAAKPKAAPAGESEESPPAWLNE